MSYVTKKRHLTSLESVGASTKEGVNVGATHTFWKFSLDLGLNLPVYTVFANFKHTERLPIANLLLLIILVVSFV